MTLGSNNIGIRNLRKWAAGRQIAHQVAKFLQDLKGRSDYFVSNDLLARTCTPNVSRDNSSLSSVLHLHILFLFIGATVVLCGQLMQALKIYLFKYIFLSPHPAS